MPVVQTEYYIPDDIYAGLLTGEYMRFGSVVRNHKEIIAHVKEVPRLVNDQEVDLERIAAGLRNPKFVAIGLGVVVAVVAGAAFWVARKKQDSKPEMPTCVENYSASLGAYLEAVRNGNLDAGIVDRLIADLDAIKEESDSGKITIDFSPEQSDTLVELVADYTRKLAEANLVELSEPQEPTPHSEGSAIVDLRRYLEVQEQIFNDAA